MRNIYTSIATDPQIKNFVKPRHGNLTNWALQGVFLLNTILTVEDSRPESHKKYGRLCYSFLLLKLGWDKFTDYVIQVINKECENVVFMLWGSHAQNKAQGINQNKYLFKS